MRLDATSCDWILLNATGCDWILLGPTGCQWIPVDTSGCDCRMLRRRLHAQWLDAIGCMVVHSRLLPLSPSSPLPCLSYISSGLSCVAASLHRLSPSMPLLVVHSWLLLLSPTLPKLSIIGSIMRGCLHLGPSLRLCLRRRESQSTRLAALLRTSWPTPASSSVSVKLCTRSVGSSLRRFCVVATGACVSAGASPWVEPEAAIAADVRETAKDDLQR